MKKYISYKHLCHLRSSQFESGTLQEDPGTENFVASVAIDMRHGQSAVLLFFCFCHVSFCSGGNIGKLSHDKRLEIIRFSDTIALQSLLA